MQYDMLHSKVVYVRKFNIDRHVLCIIISCKTPLSKTPSV